MVIVVTEKAPKNYFLIQSKTLFPVVEFCNTVTFEEMLVLTPN